MTNEKLIRGIALAMGALSSHGLSTRSLSLAIERIEAQARLIAAKDALLRSITACQCSTPCMTCKADAVEALMLTIETLPVEGGQK